MRFALRSLPDRLAYDAGGEPARFQAVVVNTSDRFATFHLEVQAAGGEMIDSRQWYRLNPVVGAKVPPGDRSEFEIEIVGPPFLHFAGEIDLLVKISAVELGVEEEKMVVLTLGGNATLPLQLSLVQPLTSVQLGDRCDIQVDITNSNPQALSATLSCQDLPADWLLDGPQSPRLQIASNQTRRVTFACKINHSSNIESRRYPFKIVLPEYPGNISAHGSIDVQPEGVIELVCKRPTLHIPPPYLPTPEDPDPSQSATADFQLEFVNHSNLEQQATIEIGHRTSRSRLRNWLAGNARRQNQSWLEFLNTPNQVTVAAGDTSPVTLSVKAERPWLGWARRVQLEAKGVLPDSRIPLEPEVVPLTVRVTPLLAFWMQLAIAVAAALLALLTPHVLRSFGHTARVQTVQFSGTATEAFSGADDLTLRRWQVRGRHFDPFGTLGPSEESVQVLRYRPRQNSWLAVGYESGRMQLWDLRSGESLMTFSAKEEEDPLRGESGRDDRVRDILFSSSSQFMYSAHGSGRVFRWGLRLERDSPGLANSIPQEIWDWAPETAVAIEAIAFAGTDNRFLVAVGQFGRVYLRDLRDGAGDTSNARAVVLADEGRTSTTLVTAVAVAESQPDIMATADTLGDIRLWDLRGCEAATVTNCDVPPPDQWEAHAGEPVRSVALTADGCFLASGGENGRVMLWLVRRDAVASAGGVRNLRMEGQRVMGRSRESINAVDIVRLGDRIYVASGGGDTRVRLHTYDLRPSERSCLRQP